MGRPGFHDIDAPRERAVVGLEQVDDKHFRLLKGFTYVDRAGLSHHVFSWHLACTDLTSIPRPFRWFEGRHGRHTLPALLHDHQVAVGVDDPGSHAYWVRRTQADDRFRASMAVVGVPAIRRDLMWAAVQFLSRVRHHGRAARWAMATWSALALIGTYLVAVRVPLSWLGVDWWPVDAPSWLLWGAALAPIPAALACWVPWGMLHDYSHAGEPMPGFVLRRWWCGLVMGAGMLALLPVGALNALAMIGPALADVISRDGGETPWDPPGDCDD